MSVRTLKTILSIAALCLGPSVHAAGGAALFGAAAIAGAITPAVVGGIQAGADKYIAGLDAATQMYITDSNNRTSQALGYLQMGTSLQLASMQAQNAIYGNQQMTLRQQMQLDAVGRTNAMNYQMQMQQMATDYQLRFAALAIQNKTLDLQYKAGTAQGGLVPQFALRSDGDALSVRSYGLASGGSALSATPLLVTTPGANVAAQSSASNRLLSSVQNPPVVTTPTAIRSTRALQAPSRAIAASQPIQARGIASVRGQAPEWVRHIPAREASAPAAQEPVLAGGHKNPGL